MSYGYVIKDPVGQAHPKLCFESHKDHLLNIHCWPGPAAGLYLCYHVCLRNNPQHFTEKETEIQKGHMASTQ